MAAYQTNNGSLLVVNLLRDHFNLDNPFLCLMKEMPTPKKDMKLTDLVECDFTGYARIPVETWTIPEIVDEPPYPWAEMFTDVLTFSNTGGTDGPMQGWFLLSAEGEVLQWTSFDILPVLAGGTFALRIRYRNATYYTF